MDFDQCVENIGKYFQMLGEGWRSGFALGITLVHEWKNHVEKTEACNFLQNIVIRRLRGKFWRFGITKSVGRRFMALQERNIWIEDEWLQGKARECVVRFLKCFSGDGQTVFKAFKLEEGKMIPIMLESFTLTLTEEEIEGVMSRCGYTKNLVLTHNMVKVPVTASMLGMCCEDEQPETVKFYCVFITYRQGTFNKIDPVNEDPSKCMISQCFHTIGLFE